MTRRGTNLGLGSGRFVVRDLGEGRGVMAADGVNVVLPPHRCVLYTEKAHSGR